MIETRNPFKRGDGRRHPFKRDGENETERFGACLSTTCGVVSEGLLACPFCGVVPEPFDGDYVIYHKAKCFLKTGSGNQYIVGQRAHTAWNTRVI